MIQNFVKFKIFMFVLYIGIMDEVIAQEGKYVAANSPLISYSSYIDLEMIPSPVGSAVKAARFKRNYPSPNQGYDADNPGGRVRFKTASKAVTVHLFYNELHISKTARKPIGIWLIDGKTEAGWSFTTTQTDVVRKTEKVDIVLPVPGDNKAHTYEIVMPYGDSVDFLGVTIGADSELLQPDARKKVRCLFYGDSVTQGFTASSISATYAYLVCQKLDWEMLNLGMSGASTNPGREKNTLNSGLAFDRIVVFLGVNDWQAGVPVEIYKRNIRYFLERLSKERPDVPVYAVTSLWVHESWKPKSVVADLEEYRKALRDVVTEISAKNVTVVEGPELIDHERKFFEIPVHPNDSGSEIMAERLSKILGTK